MKRYEWDDLLDGDELLSLTEEAMEPPARRRRPRRRWVALAACAALVVCLANFSAIAAGAQRLVRYISGVGPAERSERILVQEGIAERTHAGWTYRVAGATQIGDYVHLTVAVQSGEAGESCSLWMQLRQNGTVLPVCHGVTGEEETERYVWSVTSFCSLEGWRQEYEAMGLNFPARYGEEGALAFFGTTFRAGEGNRYDLALRADPDGAEFLLKLEFTDRTEERTAVQQTFDLEGEPVRASVSADGRRLFLEMDERTPDGALRYGLLPHFVQFVDSAGNRYPAAAQYMYYWKRLSSEVWLEEEPAAPIVAVEIGGLGMGKEDTTRPYDDCERFQYMEYENLDWRVELN